jgi:hypothetical protein
MSDAPQKRHEWSTIVTVVLSVLSALGFLVKLGQDIGVVQNRLGNLDEKCAALPRIEETINRIALGRTADQSAIEHITKDMDKLEQRIRVLEDERRRER